MDVPQFIISWSDEFKFHTYVGEKEPTNPQKRKIDDLTDIARHMFIDGRPIAYKLIIDELQERLNVKERQAKNYLMLMKGHQIIEAFQGLSGTYRLNVDPFSVDFPTSLMKICRN